MKKLILCVAVSAFALASSVQADNSTKAPTEKKAMCTDSSKACCSGGKSACTKGMPSKTVLMSPKAAAAAGRS